MQGLDVAIVLLFVASALGSGLRHRRLASTGLEEYFLAGRSLGGWRAGASMAATQFAADTPLVVTGLIATKGVFSLWQFWSYGLAFLLLGFVFAPCWRRARVLTDAELTELRYAGRAALWLRGLRATLYGTLFNCVVLAMVLFASTLFAEEFLHWNQWLPPLVFEPIRALVEGVGVPFSRGLPEDPALWVRSANNLISILAIAGLTLLYSATGGLRSVVATDLVQLGLMLGGTALFAGAVVSAALAEGGESVAAAVRAAFATGGPGGIGADELLAVGPGAARDASLGLLLVFALQWLLQRNADGTGYLAQRVMACRSDADARLACVVFAFLQIVLRSLLWIPLGLALLLVLPPEAGLAGDALVLDRERSFVRGMALHLPPGGLGLMLAAMLAALASTVDTHLNWGASYWANDIYRRLICEQWLGRTPSPRGLVWVARVANVGILALALVLMSQLGSVQAAWKASLVLGAGLGPVMVLRWLWWRLTAAGEIASILLSALLGPVVFLAVSGEALQMASMALLSTAGAVAVSLLGAAEDRAVLRRFFAQVQPPGFWGPVAGLEGGDPRAPRARLMRDLGRSAAAAVSLFAVLLAGVGWLVEAPGPLGMPAWLFRLGLLALAGAAATVWLPALRRGSASARSLPSPR